MSGGGQKSFQINNLTMPNTISSMKYEAKKYVPGLADAGAPHVDGDDPREGVRRNFQKTIFTMLNNVFSIYLIRNVL